MPLQEKATAKSAPGPPETKSECVPHIARLANASMHVIGSDSSTGLRGCYSDLGLQAACARHSLSEWTPAVKLNRKHIPKAALRVMTATSRGSKPAAKVSQRTVTMVGGDQNCESIASQVKGSLRRLGKYGKIQSDRGDQHIAPLSAKYLADRPGFLSGLTALKCYREHGQDRIAP